MGLSPPSEANGCSANHILRNPKGRYSTLSNSPPMPILSQMNPVHTLPSHMIRLALSCNLRQGIRKLSLSCTLYHQNNTCNFLSLACHTPFHPPPLYFITNIWSGVPIMIILRRGSRFCGALSLLNFWGHL
jgi:hypothetical protein